VTHHQKNAPPEARAIFLMWSTWGEEPGFAASRVVANSTIRNEGDASSVERSRNGGGFSRKMLCEQIRVNIFHRESSRVLLKERESRLNEV